MAKAKGFNWSKFETQKAPPGAITVEDFAEHFNVSISAANHRLKFSARNGELNVGKFRNEQGRWANYYWEK